MDILAARKKAAEKARSQKSPETAATEATVSAPDTGAPTLRADEQVPAPPAAGTSADNAPEEADGLGTGDTAAEQAPLEEVELLSFRLGDEHYAVMVDDVREVLKPRDLTPVPNTPDYVLGVTSLRGTMLPVVDLCIRLGLAPGVRDEKSRIIVISPDEEDVGLLADRVTGVFRVSPDAVKPAPENIEQGAEFLRGIVRKDDRLFILLDVGKITGV